MDNVLGKMLEQRYLVEELIGVGGMANVYKGFDMTENRPVAIKMLRDECADSDSFLRRMRNESKAIYSLDHANIVKIYDVLLGLANPAIIMEYVEGITLKDYIEKKKTVPSRVAAALTMQLMTALQHAHDNGIVHRDIKPQNIMVQADGTIKVMDFGIARFTMSQSRTLTNEAIGSVHYISPEQARGDGVVDQRTDIYSAGVILFEMLTGKLPFEADSPISVALKQIEDRAVRPRELNPDIPQGLEDIVVKAMCKNPDGRYQSAGEMLRDLEQFIQDPQVVFGYAMLATQLEQHSDAQKFMDSEAAMTDRPVRTGKAGGNSSRPHPPENRSGHPAPKGKRRRRITYLTVLMGITSAFVVGTLVFMGVMVFINKPFAKVPETDCPNLVGQSYDTVRTDKEYRDFTFEVESQEFSNQYPKGAIFEQTPKPGKRVKEGITIKVKVSTGSQSLTLPDFKDQEATLVYAKLTELGLPYETQQEMSQTIAEGNVTQTSPGKNETVVTGQTITVFVSSGTGKEKVAVPDTVTWDISQAKEMLAEVGLVPSITYETSTMDPGTVLAQRPGHPARVDVGSKVYLVVASDEVIATADFKLMVTLFELGDKDQTYNLTVEMDGAQVYEVAVNPGEQRAIRVPLTGEGLSMVDVKIDGKLYRTFEVNFEEGTSKPVADHSGDFK